MKKIILLSTIAFIVSGCDQASPAGAKSGANESSSTASSANISKEQSIAQSKTGEVISESLLFPYMTRTITGLVSYPPEDLVKWSQLKKIACDFSDESRKAFESGANELVMKEFMPSDLHQKAIKCAAYRYYLTQLPITGYTIYTDLGMNRSYVLNANEYLTAYASAGEFWDNHIGALTNKNPVDSEKLHSDILKIFSDNAEEFNEIYERIESGIHKEKYTIANTMGTNTIQFTTASGYSFLGQASGGLLHLNGVEVFGNGYINGMKYTARVSKKNSASMSQSSGTTQSNQISNDTNSGASVGTQ